MHVLQVIVIEASKVIQDVGRGWKPMVLTGEGENMGRMGSLSEGPAVLRSPSKNWKVIIKLLKIIDSSFSFFLTF